MKKLSAKQNWRQNSGPIAKIRYDSENFARFAKFSLCVISKFFDFLIFFKKSNKVNNKLKIIKKHFFIFFLEIIKIFLKRNFVF